MMQEEVSKSMSDPLKPCIAALAAHFGIAIEPDMLDGLALDAAGNLPFHQAEAAIELAGLNCEFNRTRKLPSYLEDFPALTRLKDGSCVILHDAKDDEILVWRPETGQASWEARKALQDEFTGSYFTIFGNPDRLREAEAPWHAKGRYHWFWSELRKERRAFRPVLLASLMINMLALSLPIFTMNVYDRVIPNQAEASLWVLAVGVILAISLDLSLRTARASVIDQIGARLDLRLSQKIYSKLLNTPLMAKSGHTGSLAARVSEYAVVREFFGSTTVVLLVDLSFLVLFVGVIAYIGGWLALVPLTIMVLMAIAGFYLQAKVTAAASDASSDYGLQQTLLMESIAGAETIKSMTAEGGMIGRWYQLAELGRQSQQRLKQISTAAVSLATTFQQISTISLVIGGYYLFAAGTISMGAIIAIVMLASRSLQPAGQIAFLLTRWRQARSTLDNIEQLFEVGDERRVNGPTVPARIREADIVFDDVEFAYPNTGEPALKGLNLKFRPGERVAVIGRVASGKSTLGRVLCGLYEPTGGSMRIGGLDSRQLRPHEIRNNFRFVGQDADIFTGSIKDNLVLGRPDVSEQAMIAALGMTGGDAFLLKDAGGFDRMVGEHGRRLSGGQRTFLAITRALVNPSKLLFLDEPTGAMDSATEQLFVQHLSQKLPAGQTLVVSTHRSALFSLCERLIVLDGGRVAADGPIAEVMAASQVAVGQGERQS
ncbi:MAG: type I secretion system permease/ATPase [Sphingomonadales bacterium]|nr:type I secretion system permease/ATPase [Sphingomonadales bacterium]MBD3774633.1 type I secretion system permease/ATPase [Paracoccaceae bacterium]